MKKMVLNKKAQGLPTSTLVLMVIAILVLVFVVLGFTTGWGYIFDKIGLLPDDLTAAAAACDQYAGNDALKISFCEFRELRIEGQKGYYNCDYIYAAATRAGAAPTWSIQDCPPPTPTFCNNNKLKNSTIVSNATNTITCQEIRESK